jgi:8-hydroxy-5-deazaflavin:NADPH oxidoreductase
VGRDVSPPSRGTCAPGPWPDAKRTVIDRIDQLGFTAVDTGTLAESRRQQPGSSLYRAFAKARAAGETLTASRARQLLAAAPERHAVPDLLQGGS